VPKEIVKIGLLDLMPYEPGAKFFSVIAYPDSGTERQHFFQALIRWTIEKRMEIDKPWATSLQLLKPAYFSYPEKQLEAILKRGMKRLGHRLIIAHYVVIPHLRAMDMGYLRRVANTTLSKMIEGVAATLGMKKGSQKTIESKIWKPTKPVAHAISAYYVWHSVVYQRMGHPTTRNKFWAFMMVPDFVKEVVDISENFREQVPRIKQFRIKEDELIQFTAGKIELSIPELSKLKSIARTQTTPL